MSRQINLVNPALRKQRDWLTAIPVAAAGLVLLTVMALATIWAHWGAASARDQAEQAAAGRTTAQEALVAATQANAARKPNPALATELATMRTQLARQQEIIDRLDSKAVGDSAGFSEYLKGFARQVPTGLWLTGFTIGAGGRDMELRGRMTQPSLLTEYVRRLNAETAFRGRSFAGLQIQLPRAEPATATNAAGPAYPEFVLTTVQPGAQP